MASEPQLEHLFYTSTWHGFDDGWYGSKSNVGGAAGCCQQSAGSMVPLKGNWCAWSCQFYCRLGKGRGGEGGVLRQVHMAWLMHMANLEVDGHVGR
jgi:hypothetical protein